MEENASRKANRAPPPGRGPHASGSAHPVSDTHPGLSFEQLLLEIREANERLVLAGVRAQQLTDAAVAAQHQAEAADHAKDQFLAALSHELRTPLNAIVGWTHMLRKGMLSPEAAERALETIERNANLQTQLIGDLLEVAQIATGKLRLKIELVDLASVLTAATHSLLPAVAAKQIVLTTEHEGDVPAVMADPARVQQVIWNLVSNAIKFTPQDGRIAVSLRRTPTAAEIRVQDSGYGIDPAFVPYMFGRFRQGMGRADRGIGGLGLGLSIVRQLMELHGGTVRGESDGLGHGATFTVAFPIPQAEQLPARV